MPKHNMPVNRVVVISEKGTPCFIQEFNRNIMKGEVYHLGV